MSQASHRRALTEQKTQLVAYLHSKLTAGDLHAVQDAASDLREIDAQLKLLTILATEHDDGSFDA